MAGATSEFLDVLKKKLSKDPKYPFIMKKNQMYVKYDEIRIELHRN